MKPGVAISAAVGALALIGLTIAFMSNASPYLTIEQVANYSGRNAHVVGKIAPKSLQQDARQGTLRFALYDKDHMMAVEYKGAPVANLQSANQVVVIGGYKAGVFYARDILVKCPSKYESEATSAGAKSGT